MTQQQELITQNQYYYCQRTLDLYNSPQCQGLATQAAQGRCLRVEAVLAEAVAVQLCEDDYRAWLPRGQVSQLQATSQPYQPIWVSREEIISRIPEIIAFMKAAMAQPHYYHWGGTVAPNYDCSGLMQAAFSASGVWLPRDSYQQAAFTETISPDAMEAGDLIFFQEKSRVDHVALYLGDGQYIHSSGQRKGRNGIGIDRFSPHGGEIAQNYYPLFHSAGRVTHSYYPGRDRILQDR
ncbi:NlpC/P60 family protein [Spirulina sp. CS-785/01]|uniref:C40 family peptidase n=1 Tax=Spirulina sp. CS-785/01 TaxID=3021716 RepID=UPI002330E671|nr:C40 family peptidase [Spirulina sp. CS-785/01]MDB9311509.1 NlpC/P60 family protein [Spirulina sp. CS-785/01]